MSGGGVLNDPKISGDPLLQRVLADVDAAAGEADRFRGDAILRKDELFSQLEGDNSSRRLICYLAATSGIAGIDHSDAAPLGSVLDAVGDCDHLDLMLNSPGGVGEVAEKLVEMCRSRCNGEFRVIVPNFAKSAATMVALGADVIVMAADRSELGPTDPQYEIQIGGELQVVSGQSFVSAYELAQAKVVEASENGEPIAGLLQSLASSTMEPAFIEHCRRGINFSRDIAGHFLRDYQLPAKAKREDPQPTQDEIKERAQSAAEDLLSAAARFSHGRLIGPEEARDKIGLNIEILGRDDSVWQAYWELYVRAEVYMQASAAGERQAAKLFMNRESVLQTYY
jgi:Serine dehydrogenase proteinase